jgi:aqualysin 1
VLGRNAAGVVKDRYIVVMKNSTTTRTTRTARQVAVSRGAKVHYDYATALHGFAATLPAAAVRALRNNPDVAYIEADRKVSVDGDQSGATWGIDRVDQRALPLSSTYHYDYTGAGVTAYIIDTGIRFAHNEFGGRATSGYDAVDGGSADDCNGHGTHVAGTVGGSTYGVAKGVSLVAVRVLNCSGSGTWSGVIAGINYVTGQHATGAPAVANMSLGGGASSSVDTAVRNSILDGVSYAIAAGNGNAGGKGQNACNYSPARVSEAMTIGATDRTDTKPRWSNYGSCVDLFAPGVSITSAWYTSNTATNTISGTSMATPHVAGVAAQYLQSNTAASPATVRNALYNNATLNVVKSSSTTDARLLFTNY